MNAEFEDDRRNGNTNVSFDIDDAGEADITNFSGAGTNQIFTNQTLVNSIGLPFTSTFNVTDSPGATSNNWLIDLSETDSGLQEDDHAHALDDQQVNRTVTISNDASRWIDYRLALQNQGTVVTSEIFTGNLSATSSVTHTGVWSGDWLTGETESTYNRYADADYDHGEDRQRIHNRTQLTVDNAQGFAFTGVDISGQCSQTATADVASGTDVLVTDDCNRPTFLVDTISQTVGSLYEDSGDSHTLSAQYAAKDKTLDETAGYSYTGVDISAPSLAGTCTDCSTRNRDISGLGSVTETYNSHADWITGETETDVRNVGENASEDHTLATQHVVNETELVADNSRSFAFTDVDLSGRCENTVTADVASGSGVQITDNCSSVTRSGDFITGESESSHATGDDGTSDTLDTQSFYNQTELKVTNAKSFQFTGVDLSAICSTTTVADIPSGTSAVTTACNNNTYSGDFITDETENDVRTVGENASKGHTLAAQYIINETELVADNSKPFTFKDVDLSGPCENTVTADIGSGIGIQVTDNCSSVTRNGDFISGITEDTYQLSEDLSYDHDEDQQRLENRTNLSVTNSQPFAFTSVDISSQCSQTATATVPSGTSEVTTDCNRPTFLVDYITQSTGSVYQDTSQAADLATQYLAKDKTLSEQQGISWTGVNVSAPSIPGSCTNCGQRTVDVPGGGSVTETYNSTGDFINGETENDVRTVGENASRQHTLSQQYIINETELVVDNSRSITFSAVDISATCENTATTAVPSGTDVQATDNCSSVTRSADFLTDVKEGTYDRYADPDFDHGEDQQQLVNRTNLTVTNTRSFAFTGVDISARCSATTSADVPAGSSQVTSDCNRPVFDVDHIAQSVGDEYQDASRNSTLTAQYIARDKTVTEQGGFAWSQVNISAPSIPGSCTNCGQRERDLAAGGTVTETYNASSDWLTERNYRFDPPDHVTLGVNYNADRHVEIQESLGLSWTGINTTAGVNTPGGCTQVNTTTVNVSASTTINRSIQFTCSPGSIGLTDLDRVADTPTQDHARYWYNASSITIASNETENSTITWKITESKLEEWDDRVADSAKAVIGPTGSRNVSVEDGTGYVYVHIGTNHSNSSLGAGTYTSVGLKYDVETTAAVPGGGLGGTDGDTDTDDEPENVTATIRFDPANPYEVAANQTTYGGLKVKNFAPEANTVELAEAGGNGCQYIQLQRTLHSDQYGDRNITYSLDAAPSGDLFRSTTRQMQRGIRFQLPPKYRIHEIDRDGVLTCNYTATATRGRAENLHIRVTYDQSSLIQFLKTVDARLAQVVGAHVLAFNRQIPGLCAVQANRTCTPENSFTMAAVPTAAGTTIFAAMFLVTIMGGVAFRRVML